MRARHRLGFVALLLILAGCLHGDNGGGHTCVVDKNTLDDGCLLAP
jgi:hypothetical protein